MARIVPASAGEESALPFGEESAQPLGEERALPLHDRERLGQLLQHLEPRLSAVALRITKHPESARDVVQSAFEKAIRHGHRFKGHSLVSTWMHRIVANEALMWLRAQRRRGEVQTDVGDIDLTGVADVAPDPGERASHAERRRRLHHVLRDLPQEERDVLLSCTLAEETYADYGARIGVHASAVKSRAFRARQRLGALMAETSAEVARV